MRGVAQTVALIAVALLFHRKTLAQLPRANRWVMVLVLLLSGALFLMYVHRIPARSPFTLTFWPL